MNVLSINVGLPRIVEYHGEPVATGIFKTPVSGTVKVGDLNLEGDRQADLRVHGGYYKAVYVYPSEHYEYWRTELPEMELSYGIFGENLTSRSEGNAAAKAFEEVGAQFLLQLPHLRTDGRLGTVTGLGGFGETLQPDNFQERVELIEIHNLPECPLTTRFSFPRQGAIPPYRRISQVSNRRHRKLRFSMHQGVWYVL